MHAGVHTRARSQRARKGSPSSDGTEESRLCARAHPVVVVASAGNKIALAHVRDSLHLFGYSSSQEAQPVKKGLRMGTSPFSYIRSYAAPSHTCAPAYSRYSDALVNGNTTKINFTKMMNVEKF